MKILKCDENENVKTYENIPVIYIAKDNGGNVKIVTKNGLLNFTSIFNIKIEANCESVAEATAINNTFGEFELYMLVFD